MNIRRNPFAGIHGWSQWLSIAVAATVFLCGLLWQSYGLLAGGAALLCIVLRPLGARNENASPAAPSSERRAANTNRIEQETVDQPRVLERLQSSARAA